MRRRQLARTWLLVACVALSSGCNYGRLQFRGDHRLSFQAPEARHRVNVPLTVRWTMKDFDVVGLDGSKEPGRGVFAVFLDRAPLPVGKDLRWLGKDDAGCRRDLRCPDTKYLNDRNVFLTQETSLTIDQLPAQSRGVGDERHDVTIVLLDGSGRRMGEANWYLPFTSKRRSS